MTNRRLVLPDYVRKVMIKLYDEKFNVYVTGDCMRKFARNRKIHQYTLVTNARLRDIVEMFDQHYPTLAHKNEFKIKKDGHVVILKVFDKDTLYIDDYLSNTGFTFDSIAYTFDNKIIDNYCGIQDLRKGCVKGVKSDLFDDKPLKIVEAVKFACMFQNGYIDCLTYRKIQEKLESLDNVSLRDFKDDFIRMVYTKNAPNVFRKYPDIISKIIPYSKEMLNKEDLDISLYERMIRVVENLSYHSKRPTLAAIYLLSGKISRDDNYIEKSVEISNEVLNEFEIKTQLCREVSSILENFEIDLTNETNMRRVAGIFGLDIIKEIYALRIALEKAYGRDSTEIENERNEVLNKIESLDLFRINDIVIDGLYLHNQGLSGDEVGKKLIEIFDAINNGLVKNSEEEIMKYLKR